MAVTRKNTTIYHLLFLKTIVTIYCDVGVQSHTFSWEHEKYDLLTLVSYCSIFLKYDNLMTFLMC